MPEQDITTTPVAEVPATTETTVQTIGDVMEHKEVEKPVNTVPENIFLKEKMARKDAEKRLKELEASITNNTASRSDVAEDIASIAKEFDIDPTFLDKLEKSIRSKTEKEFETKLDSKFKPMEEKERQAKIDSVFEVHFNQAISAMPEFAGVVNPAVIKSLSLLPHNGNKTFTQLIEETYGNAVSGKRTMTPTTPGGGKDPAPLDFDRANRDTAYFNEVMANPKLKADFNDKMLRSGF